MYFKARDKAVLSLLSGSFFICVDLSLADFYSNGFLSKLLNFMRGGIIQKL